MKDFEALKDIWNGQIELPGVNSEDILKNIKKNKRAFANKLLFEIAGMALVISLLLFIWTMNTFTMWTSHLSMAIFICCCLYYIISQLQDYREINNSDLLLKQPQEYIDYLKGYRKRRYLFNTRKYAVYSIFIGIAFGLYFIEIYSIAAIWQTLIGVIFTGAWFVICWQLMKVYIKREEEKLDNMITNLERLKNQFAD